MFNTVYAASRELSEADRVLLVKGRVDHKQEGETKLVALEVRAFDGGGRPATEVRLRVERGWHGPASSRKLGHVVATSRETPASWSSSRPARAADARVGPDTGYDPSRTSSPR